MHGSLWRLRVLGSVEIKAVLLKVKHGGLGWGAIEQVSQVFKSDEDLVSILREEVDLEVAIELSNIDFRGGNTLSERVSEGLCHEESNRLIDLELHLALLGGNFSVIEELNEVAGIDLNALTISVGLVEGLAYTTAIIVQQTPVLHDLNDSVGEYRASLRAIVHDSELHAGGWATNGQGRVDGVVVG